MKNWNRTHLIVIGLYLVLALALTWPLAAQITTHIPGEATWAFDESTFIWNMWWLKFSVLNQGQSPLFSDYTFFPLGVNLTTYTFNLFNAALGLPLQLTLSLPLANNLVLLFSYVSSAYGMFLLMLYLLAGSRSRAVATGAAFVAGAVFAFSASRMMYVALGHYNFVTIQWFPFYVLFLLKTLRQADEGERRGDTPQAPRPAALAKPLHRTKEDPGKGDTPQDPRPAALAKPLHRTKEDPGKGDTPQDPQPAALAKRGRRGRFKNAMLAGIFAAMCMYAELTFSVFLLFLTVIIVGGEWLSRRKTSRPTIQPLTQLLHLLFIGLTAFILTAPFIFAVLPDFLDPAYAEPGWGEGLKLSADLVGLVTLTPLHPRYPVDWVTELRAVIEGTSRFSDANTLFLGYAILALALVGFVAFRKVTRVWLWSAIIFTVLSLGPLLTINGRSRFDMDGIEVTFPLPFALLHYIPILSANRVPNRFGIPLTLALAVLVGYGVAWLLTKITGSKKRSGLARYAVYLGAAALLALLLFDQFSAPLPHTDARIPAAYAQIGAETEPFTLMQLPLGWRNSYGTLGAERTQLQYYQAAHQRPMLGGNTSRNPHFKFDYFANIPLFRAITEAELYRSADDETLARARQQAAELMTLYNIKYLAVHEPIPHRKPYEDTYLATRILALDLIPHQPQPVYQSPGVEVFAVQPADIPNPQVIDLGNWPADPYRGEGWAGNEEIFAATANWATAPQATLFFPVRGPGERRMTLHIAPFSYPGMPEQYLSLTLNGQPVAENSYLLREGWQQIEATLPEAALMQGLNRLTLQFAHTARPREVLPANRAIGSTGVDTPTDIEVNSGADFAFITTGFGDSAVDASAHRRGLNVAVVDAATGDVIDMRGFDTAANEFEATALAQFIANIPPGQIVVIASQGGDATAFLTPEAQMALGSVGLTVGGLQPPFSAIGVKGVAAGTALQAAGEGTSYLRLGAVPDDRPLAAAVDRVEIAE